MKSSNITCAYKRRKKNRVHQGDILRDIRFFVSFEKRKGKIKKIEKYLPYAIVVTQDCDLKSDYICRKKIKESGTAELPEGIHDKLLPTILILPAYPADQFREGVHLGDMKMQKWGSDLWKTVKKNEHKRFYYLKEDTDNQMNNLIIDFKHYYTLPTTDVVYKNFRSWYLISMNELFREELSQRYINFLGRIGLPTI